jgi:hypothetical protein
MPFTMEGTTIEASGASSGVCVAALVLGILSIPAACTLIIPALAILFGILGYNQANNSPDGAGKGMAITGICCGLLGAGVAAMIMLG